LISAWCDPRELIFLIVQVKHNLEEEVENIETEIVKLRAQLEGDNDFEETKMSAEESVAEDEAWCENVVSVAAASQDRLSDLSQKSACHSSLQEHMHGSLEFKNVGSDWSVQHEIGRNVSQTHGETLTFHPPCVVTDAMSADNDVISCRLFSETNETVLPDQSARLLVTQQEAVSNFVKEELATCEAEDWPEFSANTMNMLFKGDAVMPPHVTTDRQSVDENTLSGCVSLVDDVGDRSACDYKQGPIDKSVVNSLVGDSDCAVPLVDELTVNTSCIQSAHTNSIDHDTLSAIPDSLDGISAACDAAADDKDSCVSCEDIVIPDSEDDLFCSPHNGHFDHTALASHHDESKHVNKTVTVSDISSDVLNQSDAMLVNVSHAHSSETIDDSNVDCWAENVKQEVQRSKTYGRKNSDSISRCNRLSNQANHVCVSDTVNADIIKHADCLSEESHLSSSDETFHAAIELRQPPTLSVVPEQLPKRPHWTLVVSGISQALDQVIYCLQLIADFVAYSCTTFTAKLILCKHSI